MNLPEVQGLIRRRILVNFRVDPDVMQRQLPAPFRVKTVGGKALAGICLIRLEQIRPGFVPLPLGAASENAAHCVAVCWTDPSGEEREGVYISRRDTSSHLTHWVGGRLFPGEHQHAAFQICDEGGRIDFAMRSDDGEVTVRLRGQETDEFPNESLFSSLGEASAFFQTGSVGYSATAQGGHADGVRLSIASWRVTPLHIESVYSSCYADESRFPAGSIAFDCALLMRDIPHTWLPMPEMATSLLSRTADCGPVSPPVSA
ncbi:MAG: DUF2071 domain-containing protein [Armatimonadota bacterium]|nr:DUF2071 domain-containing protein [Armatimonadota bacterium]